MSEAAFQMAEMDRRLANLIAPSAEVIEVSNDGRFARVKIGTDDEYLETDFIPVLQLRMGDIKFHFPPDVGEAVSVYAPSGEYNAGYIGPSMTTDNNHWQQNGKIGIEFANGAYLTFETSSQNINLTTPGNVTVQGANVNIKGSAINLGDGGKPVARIGDSVAGGKIVSGSSIVMAG